MNLTLQSVVDAFERMSLDDRLYIVMPSRDDLNVCIEFDRSDQFRCWKIFFKDAPEESAQKCSRLHFVEIARAFFLNENALTKELSGYLLTQAAFADQFVREVQEFLGHEAVRESILRTQLFMDTLKEAVSSALQDRSLTKETQSIDDSPSEDKNTGQTSPTNGPLPGLKLRVIKSS